MPLRALDSLRENEAEKMEMRSERKHAEVHAFWCIARIACTSHIITYHRYHHTIIISSRENKFWQLSQRCQRCMCRCCRGSDSPISVCSCFQSDSNPPQHQHVSCHNRTCRHPVETPTYLCRAKKTHTQSSSKNTMSHVLILHVLSSAEWFCSFQPSQKAFFWRTSLAFQMSSSKSS